MRTIVLVLGMFLTSCALQNCGLRPDVDAEEDDAPTIGVVYQCSF